MQKSKPEDYRLKFKVNNERKYLEFKLDDHAVSQSLGPAAEYERILKQLHQQLKPDEKILIPMSGGIDSEVMARACLSASIPFTPVIMQYKNDYNSFDTKIATLFCQEYKLQPNILHLDLDSFYKKETHLDYATKYQCRSPQLATHLWMIEQVEGFFIFPHNPAPIGLSLKNKFYIGFPPQQHLCYENYFLKNNRLGVGLFNIFDSRIVYSFLKMNLYLDALFNPIFFRTYCNQNYFFKTELYRQAGFKVKARKDKATGFETYRQHLNQLHNIKGKDYFDENFRQPMEDIVKDPQYLSTGNVNLKALYDLYVS